MSNEELINKVMGEVMRRVEGKGTAPSGKRKTPVTKNPKTVPTVLASASSSSRTELVGTNQLGQTIGLLIPNIDETLQKQLGIDAKYRSVGLVGSNKAALAHLFAADEAIKATNAIVLSVEQGHSSEGELGLGCLIMVGSEDLSDTKDCVEQILDNLESQLANVYSSDAGSLQLFHTARAGQVLVSAVGAKEGSAFGLTLASPAAIGLLIADTCLKSAAVELTEYKNPKDYFESSNIGVAMFTGDAGSIKQAVDTAKELGLELLSSMGSTPEPIG